MKPWRIRVTLTPEQEAKLDHWFEVPLDVDLKTLPSKVQEKRIQEIESWSALGQRQIRSPEWKRKNAILLKKAQAGDGRAFLELVGRDPQYLCSDLGLFFVCQWQAELNAVYSIASSAPSFTSMVKEHPSRACVESISSMLMRPFDRRGQKAGPRDEEVKICYYGALVLFSGLKRLSQQITAKSRVAWADDFRKKIAQVVASEIRGDSKDGFFIYVQRVGTLATEKWPNEFDSMCILNTPAHVLASRFVGKLLNIQERTMRERLKGDALITWNLNGHWCGIVKPNLKLEDYSPVQAILVGRK